MISRTSSRFWDAYADLPQEVKRRARTAYQLFEENPRHPGLRFKKVHTDAPIYSVRITRDYRALGVRDGEAIVLDRFPRRLRTPAYSVVKSAA